MEISYETILKVLLDTSDNNPFFNKINIIQYANEFKSFTDIFDNSFYRYGIYPSDENNNNVSFWSTLLFCFDKNYFSRDKDDVLQLITTFKTDMIEYIKSNYNNMNEYVKNNISFDTIKQYIKYNKTSEPLFLEVISEYLKINILIFDFKDNIIKSTYYFDFFNPWRPTIFLANYDNNWEPICSQETKIFSFSSPKVNILKNKILNSDVVYYSQLKEFIVNDNLNEIIQIENLDKITDSDTLSETMFTTQQHLSKDLTKNKLNKMKKEEILQLINELDLTVQFPKPTKKTLINIICSRKNI